MSAIDMASGDVLARKTVRLTTRGRSSGLPRHATIWFVPDGPRRILVQHATSAPANWYHNLAKHPEVTLDFGDGPIDALATPITEPARIQQVLAAIRKRYWTAWLIQLLGRRAKPLAAEISW